MSKCPDTFGNIKCGFKSLLTDTLPLKMPPGAHTPVLRSDSSLLIKAFMSDHVGGLVLPAPRFTSSRARPLNNRIREFPNAGGFYKSHLPG